MDIFQSVNDNITVIVLAILLYFLFSLYFHFIYL